jgi:hypothetical protein
VCTSPEPPASIDFTASVHLLKAFACAADICARANENSVAEQALKLRSFLSKAGMADVSSLTTSL